MRIQEDKMKIGGIRKNIRGLQKENMRNQIGYKRKQRKYEDSRKIRRYDDDKEGIKENGIFSKITLILNMVK